MRQSVDPITDMDLVSYVDDQLLPARRIEVEAYLAARPEDAARVMADLRSRDELRLALSASPLPVSVATNELAGRLERALLRRGQVRRFSRVAALVLLLGAGWIAHAEFNALGPRQSVASVPPPAFVHDALVAHRTALVRADMPSQLEVKSYDRAEILAATAIAMPELPAGWTVDDMQIFPSAFGPSVDVAIETADLGRLSLFAVRPGVFDVLPVAKTAQNGATAAYWQVGDVAYALVSSGADPEMLERRASGIERSLR